MAAVEQPVVVERSDQRTSGGGGEALKGRVLSDVPLRRVMAIVVIMGVTWLDLSSPSCGLPIAVVDPTRNLPFVEQGLDAFDPAVGRGGRGAVSGETGGGGVGEGGEEQLGAVRTRGFVNVGEGEDVRHTSIATMTDINGGSNKLHKIEKQLEEFPSERGNVRKQLGRRGGGGGGGGGGSPVDDSATPSDLGFPDRCMIQDPNRLPETSDRQSNEAGETDSPMIGILTLPVTAEHFQTHGQQYFATSYARWIEAGGARVVPIFFDSTAEEVDYLLNRVNGVFWTGGLVAYNPTPEDWTGLQYMKTTYHIMQHLLRENKRGRYYPLWGTCLGLERMLQLLAKGPSLELPEEYDDGMSLFNTVDAENWSVNLNFTAHLAGSHLFSGLPFSIIQVAGGIVGKHLAFHNHQLGVPPDVFYESRVKEELMVLSIDSDRKGALFISTVEGKHLPFYGTQWHPEKIVWEWSKDFNITHTSEGVQLSNYMGRFFVDECRLNNNRFENEWVENKVLLYNWQPLPTQILYGTMGIFTQVYFFRNRDGRCRDELYRAFVIACPDSAEA